MGDKIVHIASCDKFVPPFIELVEKYFDFNQHEFLLINGMAEKDLKLARNVQLAKRTVLGRLGHYWKVIIKAHQADKVILHGLFDIKLVFLLFLMPWLLKKCYWAVWGGDLYTYELGERNWRWRCRELFRRPVIRKMGHFISYVDGSYELSRLWYGAKGQHHKCFMYPSNLYRHYELHRKNDPVINILVGNSADPSNNHFEVFEKIRVFKEQDINVYVPLSYGNKDYANSIIIKGKACFGEKFTPLTEMLPFEQYLEFLASVDIAIFNHRRQQAMGNIRTLLGLGKKVFMNQDLDSAISLRNDGIKTFPISEVSLQTEFIEKYQNSIRVKEIYSERNLVNSLQEIFTGKVVG